MILADAMTLTGDIVSIGRHGLSGQKSSVLARAAFEETVKHIVNAAVMGEEDVLTGVTENILIGQPIPLGSGLVRLKMK
jgi:DNA-directed RNA polymerase subunit A"